MTDQPKPQILDGVRVIDLTRFLSGPQATLFLAGLGAEVIRIDEPVGGDPAANAPPFFGPEGVSMNRRTEGDLGLAYLKRARAKKSVTLNLKSPEGRDILYRLLETADVLVENFRVGVTDRLGLSPDSVAERFPRLIHCAITGYGSTGPERHAKAYDLMVQAASGLMSVTGDPDGAPHKAGSPLTDGIAGTFAVSGILGALYQRERTGRGQFIDVSMADCLVALMLDEPFDCYEELGLAERQGNRIMRFSPFNTYATRDGAIALGAATQQDWLALLDVMDRRDLAQSPDHMNTGWRIVHNAEIDRIVGAWTATVTTAAALERLAARDIPCSPIRAARDLADWPHLRARGMVEPVVHPAFPQAEGPAAAAFPLKFSAASPGYATPAPFVGQHNAAVYAELGLPPEALAALKASGTI